MEHEMYLFEFSIWKQQLHKQCQVKRTLLSRWAAWSIKARHTIRGQMRVSIAGPIHATRGYVQRARTHMSELLMGRHSVGGATVAQHAVF